MSLYVVYAVIIVVIVLLNHSTMVMMMMIDFVCLFFVEHYSMSSLDTQYTWNSKRMPPLYNRQLLSSSYYYLYFIFHFEDNTTHTHTHEKKKGFF